MSLHHTKGLSSSTGALVGVVDVVVVLIVVDVVGFVVFVSVLLVAEVEVWLESAHLLLPIFDLIHSMALSTSAYTAGMWRRDSNGDWAAL